MARSEKDKGSGGQPSHRHGERDVCMSVQGILSKKGTMISVYKDKETVTWMEKGRKSGSGATGPDGKKCTTE